MRRLREPRPRRRAVEWAVRAVEVREVRASSWGWERAVVRRGVREGSARWVEIVFVVGGWGAGFGEGAIVSLNGGGFCCEGGLGTVLVTTD